MSMSPILEKIDFSLMNFSPLQVSPPTINHILQIPALTIREGVVEGVAQGRVVQFYPQQYGNRYFESD